MCRARGKCHRSCMRRSTVTRTRIRVAKILHTCLGAGLELGEQLPRRASAAADTSADVGMQDAVVTGTATAVAHNIEMHCGAPLHQPRCSAIGHPGPGGASDI